MLSVDIQKRRGEFTLHLSFRVDRGVTALFGRSGCGKTTAVNLIAGLLKPDAGRIQWGDEVLFDAVQGVNVAAEKRRIGYVFQDSRLFPHFTVRGNLQYGHRRARTRRQTVQFDTIVGLLALEAMLDRRPHQLSGGERQRVAIGRALLSQPQLLLLDEPLAALDFARREELLSYLARLRDELAIPMVYVSHQFDEVLRLATDAVLVEKGRILAQGDLPSIGTRPELRDLVGPEASGAIVEGRVKAVESSGLAQIGIGAGEVSVDSAGLQIGQRVRLQLLARDLILALEPPRGLSVRNALHGKITRVTADDAAVLVEVDVGNTLLISRVTRTAAEQLALQPGLPLWVLVKTVTLRGHVFHAPAAQRSVLADSVPMNSPNDRL